ncbi:hypothetical protein AAMO2058_000181700 [Amorphochlora amoebiformis]
MLAKREDSALYRCYISVHDTSSHIYILLDIDICARVTVGIHERYMSSIINQFPLFMCGPLHTIPLAWMVFGSTRTTPLAMTTMDRAFCFSSDIHFVLMCISILSTDVDECKGEYSSNGTLVCNNIVCSTTTKKLATVKIRTSLFLLFGVLLYSLFFYNMNCMRLWHDDT